MIIFNLRRIFSIQIILVYICLINFTSSIVSAATLYAQQRPNDLSTEKDGNTCTSSLCQEEASYFLKIMNETVDPCNNFYQFVCGKFISNPENKIPEGKKKLYLFGNTQDIINDRLVKELEEIKEDDTESFKKLKTFYANCKSNDVQKGIDDLMEIINNAGGMPLLSINKWNENNFNYTDGIFTLKTYGFPVGFPAVVSVGRESKNVTKNILEIFLPENGIQKEFFVPDRKKLDKYYESMVDKMKKLGADKDLVAKEMKDCLDFEVELYNATSPDEFLRNVTATYNPMTIKELSQMVPNIPWMYHFNKTLSVNNIVLDENEIFIVFDPPALRKIGELIARTPKKVIANYLMWQLIREAFDYFPDEYTGEKSGDKSLACLEAAKRMMPGAAGAIYAQKFLSPQVKKGGTELATYLKNHFKKMLLQVDWMDEKTRRAALDKIEDMTFSVGYPDEYLDNQILDDHYQILTINNGSFMRSVLNASLFNQHTIELLLRQPPTNNDWRSHLDTDVNAYYFSDENSVVMPTAILQLPFFHPERPQYLNYGNLGDTIGHEITHGFDSAGRKYDRKGRLQNWWEPSAEKQFEDKAQCYVSQYANYTVEEVGLQIDGQQTLEENIADAGGSKISYYAYLDWIKSNNIVEPQLPGLKWTAKQMFWISAASFYCEKHTPERIQDQIINDLHSPHEARVNVRLSNFPEFAEDFQCAPGTKMNPEKKCTLW